MSTQAVLTGTRLRPAEHLSARPGAPRLRALDAPARRRPRLAYGLAAVGAALLIVGAQMMLSVMTTQSSYELAGLTSSEHALTLQKQVLTDQIAGLSSPQYLAANASALGMVIAQSPSYLRLSDGALLGPGTAPSTSTVDPITKGTVANHLIADTPLVTDPGATIAGAVMPEGPSGAQTVTPAPVTEGLPTVRTH